MTVLRSGMDLKMQRERKRKRVALLKLLIKLILIFLSGVAVGRLFLF